MASRIHDGYNYVVKRKEKHFTKILPKYFLKEEKPYSVLERFDMKSFPFRYHLGLGAKCIFIQYLLYFVVFLLASLPTQTSLEAIFTSDLSGEIAYVFLKQCT